MPGSPIVDAARHRGVVAAVLAAVLLLHAWLLGGVPIAWPGAAREAPRERPVELRPVAVPAAAVAAAPEPVATAPAPVPAPAPRARRPPTPQPPAERQAAEPAPQPDTAAAAPAVEARAEGDLPLYRAELPPPATLRYDMALGRFAGTGVLRWQPEPGRYAASFEGLVAGVPMLVQRSSGRIGPHGLEPERYTDRRARRGELAVNFDHDGGRVTFSGPSTVLDRHAGMQDRLGWLLQLAAVAAAEPARLAAGQAVSLQVIGARGDAGVWVLRSIGAETLDTPQGPLPAVRFEREARSLHDGRATVWLAAAPPHWPLRLSLDNAQAAGAFELILRDPVQP